MLTRLVGVALFLSPGLVLAQGSSGSASGWPIFERAVDETFSFSAEFEMRRATWDEDAEAYLVRISRGEGIESTVLTGEFRGQVFYDDGRRLWHLRPQSESLTVRPSARTFLPSASTLSRWARENYTVTVESRGRHRGREVVTLRLRPKAGSLPTRRWIVDAKLPLVWRSEALVGGETLRLLDVTRLREFPGTLDLRAVRDSGLSGVTAWGPRTVTDAKFAMGVLGFLPERPQTVPLGFRVTVDQLVGSESEAALASRLSDGVSSVVVYRWNWNGGQRMSFGGMRATLVNSTTGVAGVAVGDVPPDVRRSLARAFVARRP